MAIGSDAVIPDISEQPALNGSLLKVDEKQETSVEGIFAGGDLTSTERFVSSALGAGKKAAEHIDQLWAGSLRNDNSDNYGEEAVTYKEVNTFYFSRSQAVKNNLLQATERVQNFQEVQLGISEGQALSEAARCFNCGLCVQCDNCFYFCPDMAVKKGNSGEKEYSILEQYCKGCGLCVKECPRGAIVLKEESK
jgi:Pyruvate/2-oxoacid:ferredoxin oxidoreductase delta subunit